MMWYIVRQGVSEVKDLKQYEVTGVNLGGSMNGGGYDITQQYVHSRLEGGACGLES